MDLIHFRRISNRKYYFLCLFAYSVFVSLLICELEVHKMNKVNVRSMKVSRM